MPTVPSSSSPHHGAGGPRLTRRAAVAASSLAALAGCRWGPETDPDSDGTPAPDQPPATADDALVEQTVGRIGETLSLVAGTADRHPALRRGLRPLTRVHEEHLTVLDAGDEDLAEATVPARRKQAIATVRRAEQALESALSHAADDAVSGTLARTLASMAASVAQHRTLLEGGAA